MQSSASSADAAPALTPEERLRYARHLALPGFGEDGQRRLKAGSVLVVGLGGLGSPVALYLAAAGVGRLGLIDDDRVDFTNLQRQVLHGTPQVGRMKIESAAERLRAINPGIALETFPERFDATNARAIVRGYAVVVDGSDNFATRYAANDACVAEKRPLVYGAVERFEGQVSVFDPPRGPCYRCLFPQAPPPETVPSCAQAGILGVVTGIAGTLQANEVLKLLTGVGEPLRGQLLAFDALNARFRQLQIKRDPACPVCGDFADKPTDPPDDLAETVRGERPLVRRLMPADWAAIQTREHTLLLSLREPTAAPANGGGRISQVRIPLAQLHERLDELAAWRRRPVVCTCPLGDQAVKAAELLLESGFTDVAVLAGLDR
ncbi:MAG: molybdopterin-synthase adenylyltransferase MoeB [Opitutales bacterium]